ncbi:putative rhamnogalacturonate lyase C 4 [Colletotrichum chlorophyti]|uniref:Putative rhamnogalacturonate lyase C 4 n=1 Tax=Colletotrichum chlorophyti TaxID=708187 RepID=A0A1Q8RPN6_9PEZI|nr:putative rhamnogalacturonate lyase C 4 [Colletotrichum chlorophyti]
MSSDSETTLTRPRVPFYSRLLANPLTTMARLLNTSFPVSFPSPMPGNTPVTIVCVSDTHNTTPRLSAGDILVHAGDLTADGTKPELLCAISWLKAQPHRHKVVVAGNHDLCLDESLPQVAPAADDDVDWGEIVYLNGTSAILKCGGREVRIYGEPRTPRFGSWAFQYARSRPRDPWAGTVPAGTDVLVTHAPPKGHMDDEAGHWGCEFLLREVWRARPRLHVFGHVHCGRGREAVAFDELQRAYEDVVSGEAAARGGGGLMAWGKALAALGRCFWAWRRVWWRGGRRGKGESLFVNAAVVGAVGDRLVREGIVVRI